MLTRALCARGGGAARPGDAWAPVLALAVAIPVAAAAGSALSRRDADLMKQKVTTITAYAERPSKQGKRTVLTQNEVNAYLAYDATDQLPKGVTNPTISILGTGRLSGQAIVDLDAVRQQHRATSMFDPASLLSGKVPITAAGVLTTSNGVGRFALESATVAGVPIPKMLLQEIVGYYSRSPGKPSGVGLDDPFPLPAHIREIQVQRGQAVIIQ